MAERVRQQQAQARKQRKEKQALVAMKVKTWWHWANPADPHHTYLQTKKVESYGLRQDKHDGALLVPLVDGESLVNLQRIYPDGKKRFVAGGRITGCYSALGGADGPLYVCEGWATGATIHALTGAAVACAMNCGNLRPVAESLRKRHGDRMLIIAGDNDRFTDGNPGKSAAIEAAKAVGDAPGRRVDDPAGCGIVAIAGAAHDELRQAVGRRVIGVGNDIRHAEIPVPIDFEDTVLM